MNLIEIGLLIRRIKQGGWREKNVASYERTRNADEICSSYTLPLLLQCCSVDCTCGQSVKVPMIRAATVYAQPAHS